MSAPDSLSWWGRWRRRLRGIINLDVIVLGPEDVALVWRHPEALPTAYVPNHKDSEVIGDPVLAAASWAVALGCSQDNDEAGALVGAVIDWFIEKAEDAADAEDLALDAAAVAALRDK